MGVMQNLRARFAGWLLGGMGYMADSYMPTQAGETITDDKAMRQATVNACVRVISEDVASLPLHIYRREDNGGRERARDHYLYHMLHDEPNGEMTSISFRQALMVNLLLTGNAYAYIERSRAGKVLSLLPIQSDIVSVDRENGRVVYRINGTEYPGRDLLHVPGMGYNGVRGLSVVEYAAEQMGISLAAERYGASLFSKGANLGGVITTPQGIPEPERQRIQEDLRSRYAGAENAHKILLLGGGATYTRMALSPEEAQFIETQKFQRSQIAGLFRVPPHMIGDLERSTFSNIEHQSMQYLQLTLTPWLVRLEQEFNRKLLTEDERENLKIEHDTGNFLRGDTKSRYEAYSLAINSGWITVNEIRQRENLPWVDGGDTLRVPVNLGAVTDSIQTDE